LSNINCPVSYTGLYDIQLHLWYRPPKLGLCTITQLYSYIYDIGPLCTITQLYIGPLRTITQLYSYIYDIGPLCTITQLYSYIYDIGPLRTITQLYSYIYDIGPLCTITQLQLLGNYCILIIVTYIDIFVACRACRKCWQGTICQINMCINMF